MSFVTSLAHPLNLTLTHITSSIVYDSNWDAETLGDCLTIPLRSLGAPHRFLHSVCSRCMVCEVFGDPAMQRVGGLAIHGCCRLVATMSFLQGFCTNRSAGQEGGAQPNPWPQAWHHILIQIDFAYEPLSRDSYLYKLLPSA